MRNALSQDTMPEFGTNSLLLGCGGGNPDVLLLDDIGKPKIDPILLCSLSDISPQLSIYGLALSPDLNYLAVSSRSKANRQTAQTLIPAILRIWVIDDLLKGELSKPCLESFYAYSGLNSIGFSNDGYLLAATGIGTLLLYEVPGDSPILTVKALDGPFYSLKYLSNMKWATIGGQGLLQIWEQNGSTIRKLWESEPSRPVELAALQSLEYSESEGKVFWGDADGCIHWVETAEGSFSTGSWVGHDRSVIGVSWHSEIEKLVSAGYRDGKIRVWDEAGEISLEHRSNLPIVGVSSLIDKRIIVFDASGGVSICSAHSGSEIAKISSVKFRSWISFPISIASKAKRRSETASVEQRISLIRNAISSKQWAEARALINQLHTQGYGLQSLVLLAQTHKARKQFLLEYKVWSVILGCTLSDELTEIVHYGLGKVLIELAEPDLALKHFELSQGFKDSDTCADMARNHPLFNSGPVTRADLTTHDRFQQEVAKHSVLEKKFTSTVIILRKVTDIVLVEKLEINELKTLIESNTSKISPAVKITISIETVNLLKGQDGKPQAHKWIRIDPHKESQTGSWIHYALGIEGSVNTLKVISYMVFDPLKIPSNSDTAIEWNKQVLECWNTAARDVIYRSWIKTVSSEIENKIIRPNTGRSTNYDFSY